MFLSFKTRLSPSGQHMPRIPGCDLLQGPDRLLIMMLHACMQRFTAMGLMWLGWGFNVTHFRCTGAATCKGCICVAPVARGSHYRLILRSYRLVDTVKLYPRAQSRSVSSGAVHQPLALCTVRR